MMVEGYQKAFIANGTTFKVLDLRNSKISTADAGVNPCTHAMILTGGSSGAQLVVDYADGVTDDAAALIYGMRTTTATFTSGETVTGTNGNGDSVSFVLDANEVANPHWYDWTPFGNDTTTYGSMPGSAYILAMYRGRLCLSGHPNYPHMWWMSKIADPWDWIYDSQDPLSAVAGNNVDAGEIGDIVRAMIPQGDDFMIFGCASSMHILRGDPIEGGSIDKLDDKVGIYSPWSWCQDGQKNTYFFGTGGLYVIDSTGQSMKNLSFGKLPNLPTDWAYEAGTHRITLSYDPHRHGVIMNKIDTTDGSNEGYFYFIPTEGFYPESYPTQDAIFASHFYESDVAATKHLVLGGTDGFLRYFLDTAKDDDTDDTDTAINSYWVSTPIKLGEGDNQEGIAKNFTFELAGGASGGSYNDADGMSYEFHVGDDAEKLAESIKDGATARETGTFSTPGRQLRVKRRVRGLWFGVKCYNNTAAETWGLNKLTFDVKQVGDK
jgi:hypothetical protein